mmetsp:Transcript_1243/g.2370  ORF Transcript_1243/g.2370 Transcript_1243/m.2370 type:complete len:302 (-) Transcript_1243:337-1242(-)|eukprot:CAMPEP_0183735914 /NCGR_PEP_ID=MMETSP0737-20130205/47969_1 /TAXON_ID=385413 /ORGANISM="Thalassiosira miniscula, Strain CCMP1093" /LENGTH=301 /DNA_ID=CAMNT_0025969789 /DNA_START=110 /DNA_END=1015 /DNA_ORIENTATION=-
MAKGNESRAPTLTPSTGDESSSSTCSNEQKEHDMQEDFIRRKLSMRAYHLPGNTWCQDLVMHIRNNHIIFGICCHHRLHPVKAKHRFVILLGSLAFGLSVTNAIYLYYLWGRQEHKNDAAFSISLGGDVVENVAEKSLEVYISHEMALLWTVGAASHSFFDLALWHMVACACIQTKRCQNVGWNVVVAIVMLLVATTTFIAVVRAYESGEEAEHIDQDADFQTMLTFGGADFQYLYGYLIELVLSLLVYTPVIQTFLFTGILGCGMLPFLGGRPDEVRKSKRNESDSRQEASTNEHTEQKV